MRVADIFARFALIAMAAITASLWPPLAANAQTTLNPKIVLQTLPYGGVEVAAWTNESVGFAFPGRSPVKVQKVQQPSLFDFGGPSNVVLKELTP